MAIPNLTEFNPQTIAWQYDAIDEILWGTDYTKGAKQFVFSGAVGSAKSTLLAHLLCVQAIEYPGTTIGIGRRAMPDLKGTLCQSIRDHLDGVLNFDYNMQSGNFLLENGTKILSFSWADNKFKKLRSYEFSAFGIEELTENDTPNAYEEIIQRVREDRPRTFIASATNPDEPDHWAYKKLVNNPKVKTFYSKTYDNPYLPEGYIDQLKENLSEQLCERMIEGRWLSITGQGVYHAYDPEVNHINNKYRVVPKYPIHFSFDFNIAHGKPMSACAFQYINGTFHVFDEFIVEGANTLDLLNEMGQRNLFEYRCRFIYHGDATGHSRSTNSTKSDYDIIQKYLAQYRRKDNTFPLFEKRVGKINPPIRERHNIVNTYLKNANGKIRLYVYEGCETVHEALLMTKLKPGSKYIEDDSKYFQHVGTALGYGVVHCHRHYNSATDRTIKIY